MDYNAIHCPGISNFPSNPHRMPTVSAAQALEDLTCSSRRCISTGIHSLDAILQNRNLVDEDFIRGGITRGQVTDIYGPPGAGKTTLAMQLAASVLHSGDGVIWVDASHKISGLRLTQILESFKPLPVQVASHSSPSPPDLTKLLSKLTHFSTPSLAHLIALLLYPTPNHPTLNTSLIVIDSLSSITSTAFLRETNISNASKPAASKFSTLQKLSSTLQKIAATRNIAVVVTLQCVTKMRSSYGAVLIPAIDSTVWEQGLRCRLVLFRDWGWQDENKNWIKNFRLAKVVKAEGIKLSESSNKSGLSPISLPKDFISPISPTTIDANETRSEPSFPPKRKHLLISQEIADSDEEVEDYSWIENFEGESSLPQPELQISKGILVGVEVGGVRDEENDQNKENKEDKVDEKVKKDIDMGKKSGGFGLSDEIIYRKAGNEFLENHTNTRVIRFTKSIIENSDSEDEIA